VSADFGRVYSPSVTDDRANDLRRRADDFFTAGQTLEALRLYEQLVEHDLSDAVRMSRLALLYALERGQIRRGLEICQEALEKDKTAPEVYLNLARVYLKAGQKAESIHVLHAGLEQAPDHADLAATLASLGVRRRPVMPALPRGHLVNRVLGRFATWLGLR
jgi:predicted Zn-dependent protease